MSDSDYDSSDYDSSDYDIDSDDIYHDPMTVAFVKARFLKKCSKDTIVKALGDLIPEVNVLTTLESLANELATLYCDDFFRFHKCQRVTLQDLLREFDSAAFDVGYMENEMGDVAATEWTTPKLLVELKTNIEGETDDEDNEYNKYKACRIIKGVNREVSLKRCFLNWQEESDVFAPTGIAHKRDRTEFEADFPQF